MSITVPIEDFVFVLCTLVGGGLLLVTVLVDDILGGLLDALPLQELDGTGPRPLRTMWRVAREQLDDRYGLLTVGEVLDRYENRRGGTGTGASAGA
jgi:hypothetical protein